MNGLLEMIESVADDALSSGSQDVTLVACNSQLDNSSDTAQSSLATEECDNIIAQSVNKQDVPGSTSFTLRRDCCSHNVGHLPIAINQERKVEELLTCFGSEAHEGSGCLVELVLVLGETVLKQKEQIECLKQQLAKECNQTSQQFVPNESHTPVIHENRPEEFQDIQAKLESLTARQNLLKSQREKEQRKLNVILGNVPEDLSESHEQLHHKVKGIFQESLRSECSPNYVTRLGKKDSSRNRLVLVKLSTNEEKMQLLQNAKYLRGTNLFIAEDLSKEDREKRRILVKEMKKERQNGKRAYIRHSDGKLVVNGKVQALPCTPQQS